MEDVKIIDTPEGKKLVDANTGHVIFLLRDDVADGSWPMGRFSSIEKRN